MDLISALPEESRKSSKELVSFLDQEANHFDDCVRQGLMTSQERDQEVANLKWKVNSQIVKIILKN